MLLTLFNVFMDEYIRKGGSDIRSVLAGEMSVCVLSMQVKLLFIERMNKLQNDDIKEKKNIEKKKTEETEWN